MTNDFIRSLRQLHDKAKNGTLSGAEKSEYERKRDELGRLMIVAQNIGHGGATLRSNLRIAQLIKVEIDTATEQPYRTVTIDLASGGFAVLMAAQFPVGRILKFKMNLPALGSGGAQPISGTAKVGSSRPHGGLYRVSFHFQDMAQRDREHLDIVIIDYVLQRFS